jgi:hypothetical protein
LARYQRYSKLKENEKPTNLRLKRLEEKIEEQERQAAKSEADMYQWELLSRGIQGASKQLHTCAVPSLVDLFFHRLE